MILIVLGNVFSFIWTLLTFISINFLSCIDKLLSAFGNFSWLKPEKSDSNTVFNIYLKKSINLLDNIPWFKQNKNEILRLLPDDINKLINSVVSTSPHIAWAISGFLIGSILYFSIHETNKLNRPNVKPILIIIMIATLTINPLMNTSKGSNLPEKKSMDLIFDTHPLKLGYKIESNNYQKIYAELRNAGYYRIESYDKSALQKSDNYKKYPLEIKIGEHVLSTESSQIFNKPFKLDKPSAISIWYRNRYERNLQSYIRIKELETKPTNYISLK